MGGKIQYETVTEGGNGDTLNILDAHVGATLQQRPNASTEQEWMEKLGRLLADPDLRRRFGESGRRTVEERYSLRKHAPVLAATLRGVVDGAATTRTSA